MKEANLFVTIAIMYDYYLRMIAIMNTPRGFVRTRKNRIIYSMRFRNTRSGAAPVLMTESFVAGCPRFPRYCIPD